MKLSDLKSIVEGGPGKQFEFKIEEVPSDDVYQIVTLKYYLLDSIKKVSLTRQVMGSLLKDLKTTERRNLVLESMFTSLLIDFVQHIEEG
jgi:hypothetical protein